MKIEIPNQCIKRARLEKIDLATFFEQLMFVLLNFNIGGYEDDEAISVFGANMYDACLLYDASCSGTRGEGTTC